MPPLAWLRTVWLAALAAHACQLPAAAQACVAAPSDAPAFGSPSSTPFGNNNPSDPIFSDLRYQLLVPRALLPNQPFRIRDLQLAPAGSRLRQLRDLTVTLGHNPSGQLQAAMQANFVGPTRSTRVQQWLVPTTANVWNPLGLDLDFVFDPALGDLVVEFRVIGGGALNGAGTAGFRTDPAIPYVWTPGGGYSGNAFGGGGLKLRLCADANNLLALAGGCAGAAGARPQLSLAGSAQLGGPGVTLGLANASVQPLALAVLAFSFALRPALLDLGLLGAPGCLSYGFDDFTALALASAGTATSSLAVPQAPFPCMPLWAQWVVLDPAANALGLSLSNPGRLLIGN
jgi:hypothetical protein